ncbi:MAG TPA: DUF2723 domain-containing protein [Gemmatimonadaceae bacterium]|nr:DUF2723 domain-containing protein [Gemmatimonadaceae bacterium]
MTLRLPPLTRRARTIGWAVTAVAIVAGFFDLSRGGVGLAAVLLAVGYALLIPALLLWPYAEDQGSAPAPARARRGETIESVPTPWGAAAIASLVLFILYVVTLAPTTAMWDTSEYIAAAYVLGLPHPPGNPLFIVVAHSFGMIPLPLNYAARINVMAALCSALSAGIWFLITHHVLARMLPRRWQRLAGASAAALIGGTAFTVWNQSVVNEKVYTLALLGMAVISWVAIRWSQNPDEPAGDRRLIAIVYLLAIGYVNHPAGVLAAPAVGVLVLVRRPSVLLRWRLWVGVVAALVVGFSLFFFEPVRAGQFPALNEGEPTACTTEFAWSCTLTSLTYHRLKDNIGRAQYGKHPVAERQAPFTAQVGMWWLYFKWQWMRDAYSQHGRAQTALAVVFLLLAVLGGYEHWRNDRRTFPYMLTLMVMLTFVLITYLNFKYGYSQAQELGSSVEREVRDRDYFYLWTFSLWGVWAALGLAGIWRELATAFGGNSAERDVAEGAAGGSSRAARAAAARTSVPLPASAKRAWLLASPVLAIALIPFFTNLHQAPRSGQTAARDFARDLLNSVEPYGILITMGDNDTFPLWYAQEVEGVRQDVTVAVTTYLGIDWFARQLIRRPVRPYDAAKGPAIFRSREWPMPEHPPLALSMAEADAVPSALEVRQPSTFVHDSVVAQVQPGYLTRDQIILLHLIAESGPRRSIFFTSDSYPSDLGLDPYLLRQGLVTKLVTHPIRPSPDTLALPTGFFDVRRSEALWRTVYVGPTSLAQEPGWVDRSSVSTPVQYLIAGELLANALMQTGDTATARSVARDVRRIAHATLLDNFVAEQLLPPETEGDTAPRQALPLGNGGAPARPDSTRGNTGRPGDSTP